MSHNVWADLGFQDAEAMQHKCDISIAIEALMNDAKVSRRAAAKAIGISADELSRILRGHFEELPTETLEGYLEALRGKVLEIGCI